MTAPRYVLNIDPEEWADDWADIVPNEGNQTAKIQHPHKQGADDFKGGQTRPHK